MSNFFPKCPECGMPHFIKILEKSLHVCPECNHHHRIDSQSRIKYTVDKGSFQEHDKHLDTTDPLGFPQYEERLKKAKKQSGLTEAVVWGTATIETVPIVLIVMDTNFIMASLGSAVGEKITRAFEYALDNKLPVIAFCASGGARMQEGILSLMQMAKTSAAVKKHSEAGLLYISILTDPTAGGVTASFAYLGDIIIAEPKALICFAGPRVIEQTINQKLPEGFQRAEFLLDHGFLDKIIPRPLLRDTLANMLKLHMPYEIKEVNNQYRMGKQYN
ncbi:MAG: acetyl-CoA carboxylase, carboxyltransferase subunit beta [Spirochaetes bacterium]|nr:acetyl-CoA carboxylase, carboxyltransferase subunit beta [Spirochaetota bacterium]